MGRIALNRHVIIKQIGTKLIQSNTVDKKSIIAIITSVN